MKYIAEYMLTISNNTLTSYSYGKTDGRVGLFFKYCKTTDIEL